MSVKSQFAFKYIPIKTVLRCSGAEMWRSIKCKYSSRAQSPGSICTLLLFTACFSLFQSERFTISVCMWVCVCGRERLRTSIYMHAECVCTRTCCHFLHISPLIWIHALQAYHDFVHLYMCVVYVCVCVRAWESVRERGMDAWMLWGRVGGEMW